MAESDKQAASVQTLSKNNAILKKHILEVQINIYNLKNPFAQERKAKQEIETKLQDTEVELRSKIEEIEKLQLNNDRLSKRIESLVEQINELVK